MAIRTLAVLGANAREAGDSLRKARLRTSLGMIGVMVGIAAVIAMVSLGEIAREQARQQFAALGTDLMVIRKSFTAPQATLPLDAALALTTLDALTTAAPRSLGQDTFRHGGKGAGNGQVQGVTAAFATLNPFTLESGRFISDLDTDRTFAVLGAEIAATIRSQGTDGATIPAIPVGQTSPADPRIGTVLEIGERLFTIIGILAPHTESYTLPYHVDADRSVFIPLTTALGMGPNPEIEVIVARTAPEVVHTDAATAVRRHFAARAPDLELEIVTAQELIARMEAQMGIFSLLLGAVGSISLIVGGIGIMNIMLVSVAERRREIAIRRALGARQRDILSQFLIESVILTGAGGILGIALGLAATWGICRFFTQWSILISPVAVTSGLTTAIAAGLIFGLQPAWQAARMDPITGLQSE